MYFYSRTGDTHNDISTQSTAHSITAIQINTFRWNIELRFGVTSIMFQFC